MTNMAKIDKFYKKVKIKEIFIKSGSGNSVNYLGVTNAKFRLKALKIMPAPKKKNTGTSFNIASELSLLTDFKNYLFNKKKTNAC